jgi:integrase
MHSKRADHGKELGRWIRLRREHLGMSQDQVFQRMGHSDIATTMRMYRHTDEDEHRKAAERISELLAATP